jgi:membrane protease YdiL (CAAX protease family)
VRTHYRFSNFRKQLLLGVLVSLALSGLLLVFDMIVSIVAGSFGIRPLIPQPTQNNTITTLGTSANAYVQGALAQNLQDRSRSLFYPQLLGVPLSIPAAIADESFFRGYIETKLGGVGNAWRGVSFQAILFAVWSILSVAVWNIVSDFFDLIKELGTPGSLLDIVRSEFLPFFSGYLIYIFVFGILTGVYYWYTKSLVGVVLVDVFSLPLSMLFLFLLDSVAPRWVNLYPSDTVWWILLILPQILMILFARRICSFLGLATRRHA